MRLVPICTKVATVVAWIVGNSEAALVNWSNAITPIDLARGELRDFAATCSVEAFGLVAAREIEEVALESVE